MKELFKEGGAVREFFDGEWCFSDKCLVLATAFLSGLVLGFLLSPTKWGIFCGNYNGSNRMPEDGRGRSRKKGCQK